MNSAGSYTSADAFPAKVLVNEDILECLGRRVIPPYHVQFIPTNKCNLNCGFCSCSGDDRMMDMPLAEARRLFTELAAMGTRAATITGGGEPCLYFGINDIINHIASLGIEIGLVTNGLLLDRLGSDSLGRLTWCRISHADYRPFELSYQNKLSGFIERARSVDWSFSYVVGVNPNIEVIRSVVDFANRNNFTHVRLVADLHQTDKVDLEAVKSHLGRSLVDDSLVIYQGRDNPEHGGDCYIAYLKPLIAADGGIYRCCGVQYALPKNHRRLPDELKMGHIGDLEAAFSMSTLKQGHQCINCYYMAYNRLLSTWFKEYKHVKFA